VRPATVSISFTVIAIAARSDALVTPARLPVNQLLSAKP
jgi:hypothetical protein